MSQRIEQIDYAKAIGIIMVVVGHVGSLITNNVQLVKYIYSFHMPLFFIISGVQIGIRTASKHESTHCAKGFKRLMIPYFLWSLLYIVIGMTENGISIKYIVERIYATV